MNPAKTVNKFPKVINCNFKIEKTVYLIFFSLVSIWTIMILTAPLLRYLCGSESKLVEFNYSIFSGVCHQTGSRSFHILDYKLGVCSRCTGIYSGFLTGTILYPFIIGFKKIKIPPVLILLIALLPLLADSLLDIVGLLYNSFFSRTATGFTVGVVLPYYLIPGFIFLAAELKKKNKDYYERFR